MSNNTGKLFSYSRFCGGPEDGREYIGSLTRVEIVTGNNPNSTYVHVYEQEGNQLVYKGVEWKDWDREVTA